MDLHDFIKEVLDNEFHSDKKKQDINETRNGFNFACPFCGDSMKNSKAKRGNIYLNSKSFKCFNDGCMTWVPLRKFVSIFATKHGIDIADLDIDFDTEHDSRSSRDFSIKENNIMTFMYDTGAYGTMLDLEYVKDRFSLINVRTLPSESLVRQFMEKRMLFNIPNVEDTIFADSTDDVIYIFNYHKATGKILSLATRKISRKKYKVIPYSHICENLRIESVKDHADILDQLGEYFNILNVDLTRPIRTTEGQIDAMFLNNSCAVQGVTKSMFLLDSVPPNNVWTMFDRDKAGIEGSVREIKAGHKAFMWSLLIKRMKLKYSPNDLDLLKIKDTNDLYVYLYNKTKLPMYKFNEIVDTYFTESRFDMIYL